MWFPISFLTTLPLLLTLQRESPHRVPAPMPIHAASLRQNNWVPDLDRRERVEEVRLEDIEMLRFSGDELLGSEFGFIEVRDRDITKRFLEALKHAVILSQHASGHGPLDPSSRFAVERIGC